VRVPSACATYVQAGESSSSSSRIRDVCGGDHTMIVLYAFLSFDRLLSRVLSLRCVVVLTSIINDDRENVMRADVNDDTGQTEHIVL